MSILTPNMSLIESTIGIDTGLSWEQNLNASLDIIDGHNHTPGSGLPITPAAININAALTFNSNAATSVAYVNWVDQGGAVPAPINLSLYAVGPDLFFKDGSGNLIQITASGVVNATSSGISSGTATAAFVSSVLVVDASVGVGAPIDAGTYILRYTGSYPSPAGNFIALEAPSTLSTGYAITFPATTPAFSDAFYTMDTAGNLSYTNIDANSLKITGGVLSVTNAVQPTAAVIQYAGATAPSGWLFCDGSAVSRVTYAALFAVVGVMYGAGNGTTTFNIPNAVDRFAVGAGGAYALASSGGTASHTMTIAEMPSHAHDFRYRSPFDGVLGTGWLTTDGVSQLQSTDNAGNVSALQSVSPTGGGTAVNTLPPYIAFNFIIKT